MLTFAFYRAPGKFADRVIRLASWSIYSHVEFVLAPPNRAGKTFCISASKRDNNRVRAKRFVMQPDHWDYLTIPGDFEAAKAYAIDQLGTPYNTRAALLSITPCTAKVGDGLFCSQFMGLIARAGHVYVPRPHTLTPGELYDILKPMRA